MTSLFKYILLCTVCVVGTGSVAQDSVSLMDEYQDILAIKDNETRIVAELALVLDAGNDLQNEESIDLLHLRAADSPSETWQFTFTFSRGLSKSELVSTLSLNTFQSVTNFEAKFVREDSLVQTVGFTDFDVYEGSAQQVIDYILSRRAHSFRLRRSAGMEESYDDLIVERALSEQDDLRFYRIQGFMKTSDAELLVSRMADSVLHIDMAKSKTSQFTIDAPEKRVIPDGQVELRKDTAPTGIEVHPPLSAEENSSVSAYLGRLVDSLSTLLIPQAFAAVTTTCSGSTCPHYNVFLPSSNTHGGLHYQTCFYGIYNWEGYTRAKSKFSPTTDPSSPFPVQLWSYKDSSKPVCTPDFNGVTAPCTAGQSNRVYVPDAGFEHQVDSLDYACLLLMRTGSIGTDMGYLCLVPVMYTTNLPGTVYLGSQATDEGSRYSAEVGTHSATLMVANTWYTSTIDHISFSVSNPILTGSATSESVQIMETVETFPPGLDEFGIRGKQVSTGTWQTGIIPL